MPQISPRASLFGNAGLFPMAEWERLERSRALLCPASLEGVSSALDVVEVERTVVDHISYSSQLIIRERLCRTNTFSEGFPLALALLGRAQVRLLFHGHGAEDRHHPQYTRRYGTVRDHG